MLITRRRFLTGSIGAIGGATLLAGYAGTMNPASCWSSPNTSSRHPAGRAIYRFRLPSSQIRTRANPI